VLNNLAFGHLRARKMIIDNFANLDRTDLNALVGWRIRFVIVLILSSIYLQNLSGLRAVALADADN
jgi:hypothetical protein